MPNFARFANFGLCPASRAKHHGRQAVVGCVVVGRVAVVVTAVVVAVLVAVVFGVVLWARSWRCGKKQVKLWVFKSIRDP